VVIHLNPLPTAVFAFVLVCWFAFAAIFLAQKKPPKQAEQKRDRASIAGIALQGLSYAIVWSLHRSPFTPIRPMPKAFEIAIAILTAAIAAVSVWICLAAIRALGKQWAFVARVVEGHKLITDGPYSLVRNPIYTGMFGMLVATGLALSFWWALLAAVAIFLVGNRIRISAEEKLLRESFSEEFDAYARRVPAFLPRLF
jgi:protein-S-isoprenylcysteine O-methyltransferase Ste14